MYLNLPKEKLSEYISFDAEDSSALEGVLVQSKKKRISHRVHKQVRVAPDDWIMIPNHHKALITEEKFNMVQEILYKRDIKVEKTKNMICLQVI